LESEEAADRLQEEDQVSVDLASGEIREENKDQRFLAKPIPDFMMEIIEAGGLVNYFKRKGTSD
jgi:3-isopropylmalate dehydratase small subunit